MTYNSLSFYTSALMVPALTISLRQSAPYRWFWFL